MTGLASLSLLAFAVHRRQCGAGPCSRASKVETGGRTGVRGGQTLESLGLLPPSGERIKSCREAPPPPPVDQLLPSTRAAETVDSVHHRPIVQGPSSDLDASLCPLPIWVLTPPPPPPPSSIVDDALSEFESSTFAVFPSTDNDDDDDDDDYVVDDEQLRTANTCWPATPHHLR